MTDKLVFDSCDPVRHSWTRGHLTRPERDGGHTHHHKQRPASEPSQGTRSAVIAIMSMVPNEMFHSTPCAALELHEILTSIYTITFSVSQDILCDLPRLRYIIVVDCKPTSWLDMPRGIMVFNMDAVKELGSKADNCECFLQCD